MKPQCCTYTIGGWIILLMASFVGCVQQKSDSLSKIAVSEPSQGELPSAPAKETLDVEHGHIDGAHGGIIVSLGRDSYHSEAIVSAAGDLLLYMLGNDETRVQEIEIQELVAYVKPTGGTNSQTVAVTATPQPGDSEGKSSLFAGKLPDELIGQSIDVTIPSIRINGERFRLGFTTRSQSHTEPAMPDKVADDAERALYLTPGGLYTQEDIAANGNMTASEKFKGFMAAHDLKPKPGDKICPITFTKANPKCAWIIAGKNYEFCCPPCVDEFLTLAKANPEAIKAPEQYVKQKDEEPKTP